MAEHPAVGGYVSDHDCWMTMYIVTMHDGNRVPQTPQDSECCATSLAHGTRKKNPAHTHEWLDRSSPVIQKAAYEALRVSSVTSFCHSLSPKVADRVSRPRLRHPAFPEETSLLLPMGRRRHQGSGKLTSCFGGRNSELPLHQLLICLPTSPSHMDSCGFNAPRPRTA